MKTMISMIFMSVLAVVAGCKYERRGESAAVMVVEKPAPAIMPRVAAPANAELLDETGALALFAGETSEDSAFNKKDQDEPSYSRNSLYLRRRMADGTYEWRLVMTSDGSWKDADGMDGWCKDRADDARKIFRVLRARLSTDRRAIWLVCDPHTFTYSIVCRFDIGENTLRVLGDGDTADEQPDGTILIKGRKTYLQDEKGEPLGAAWYDVWITPDGKVVRKTKPVQL